MTALPITSTIAVLVAMLMIPLTMQVSLRRAALGKAMGNLAGVAFGDGDDALLRRRIRAFGNFVEYAPMCLLMLALLEFAGAGSTWVWAVGGLFVSGRIVHALAMLYASGPAGRAAGMMMTYAALTVPAAWLAVYHWA